MIVVTRRTGGNLHARTFLASALLGVGAAPGYSDGATAGFAAGRICITRVEAPEPWSLAVEFADSESQRARGLMGRVSLPADAGMLFRYRTAQPPGAGFWMYSVSFPVDIAFVDGNGTILSMQTMPPCDGSERRPCPTYAAGVSFQAALEVNGGALAAHGIRPGSRLMPCRDAPPSRTSDRAPR